MRGIFWLLLVSVFSAAALFWLFFADSVPPDPVPARPAETATAQPDPVIPPPEISAPPEDASAAATPLIVDTFPANAQPPIDTWERVGDIGGHFDVLLFQSTGAPVAPGFPIQPDMVVVARGWAGDSSLGIRFPDVLLSMCGQFVARAQVTGQRPDVAKAVHPNLLVSGWSADIFVGDLPSCATPDLEAWAVVHGRRAALAALVGKQRLNIVAGAFVREHVSAQVPVDQTNYWRYKSAQISITASRANMRRCGNTSCAVMAQVDRGTYPAAILDQADGWSLVVVGERAGWLFDELYKTSP